MLLMHLTIRAGLIAGMGLLLSCNSNEPAGAAGNIAQARNEEHDDAVHRGAYLVQAGGCNDCHTPKQMTPHGPMDDSTRLLSGAPANSQQPPIDAKALQPGNWVLMAPDMSAFVGPWGVSYPANLTSDSATGVGAWGEDVFIKTLRTGKHLGQDNGRPILPPMPWPGLAKLNDDDLKAIYAYLKSLPPISNRVPAPLSPQDAMALIKSKASTAALKTTP